MTSAEGSDDLPAGGENAATEAGRRLVSRFRS